jgi:hypothetical protein
MRDIGLVSTANKAQLSRAIGPWVPATRTRDKKKARKVLAEDDGKHRQ